MELKWAINGRYFSEFGIHVSESKGLLDKLKPKERSSYNWAEYHGSQISLDAPKYESRQIELTCWLKADNVDQLTENFNSFLQAFDRAYTQRFSLEPFDKKPYAFEVVLNNNVELQKELRNETMFGSFTLILLEPNPIKKILKTSLDKLRLSYNCSSETDIFLGDGTRQIGRGDVNFIIDYSTPTYQSSGITLVERSGGNNEYFETYSDLVLSETYMFSVDVTIPSPKNLILYVIGRKLDNSYEVFAISNTYECSAGLNNISLIKTPSTLDYGKFIFKVLDTQGLEVPNLTYSNPRIETTEVLGEWKDMTGKEKIIIIAGNIEDVKNLSTPAEILWDKI